MKATVKELRIHSKELLDVVSRGENVIITDRGQPCAKLVPYKQQNKKREGSEGMDVFGMWADRDDIGSVDDYLQNLRKGRFS